MKKIGKLLLVTVLTLLVFTGCTMKRNIELTIQNDETVKMSILMALDNEMIDTALQMQEDNDDTKSINDEARWKYIDDAFKTMSDKYQKEKYEQDEFKGYKYTVELGSLSQITKDSSDSRVDISKLFEGQDIDTKALFVKNGDNYKSNMTVPKSESESYEEYISSGAKYEINFVLNLPDKAISNNATEKFDDEKKLSWNLLEAGDIDVEFSIKKNNNTLIIVGCVAGVLVIACVLFIVLNRKKN